MSPRRFGPYRIVSELGVGAQAAVYLAEVVGETDGLDVGDRVALKILHEHLRGAGCALERFDREVRLLRAIDHPNVVRLLDAGYQEEDGAPRHYLATELVDGDTLRRLVVDDGAQSEALCRFVGREVSQGLVAIHAAGAVHRDLKPENVILTRDQKVKIMDLGVALLRDEGRVSQTGDFIGSVLYAAPEQFLSHERSVDGRADLYALGLILYEMLTGRHPFAGEGLAALMKQHLKEAPPPPSRLAATVSPFFETLLLALLAKAPDERPAPAGRVAEALDVGEASTWWRGRERVHLERARLFRPRAARDHSLVGRSTELSRLGRLWAQARSGVGCVVLAVGEAGIGKTRLVDEFVEHLHLTGEPLHYLCGSSLAGGAATAAGAFSEAFGTFLGRADLEATLAPLLPQSPGLVPSFAAFLRGLPPPPDAPVLGSDGLHTAFIRVAQALAERRPTLIVIDDLHFAPPEGRRLFSALAQAAAGHRILLVGLTRPEAPADWRAALLALPHAQALALDRLGPDAVGRLLEEVLGAGAAARVLAPRILEVTHGNPFFIRETLRAQRESGGLKRREDGHWTLEFPARALEAPPVVREILGARLVELSEGDRELLDLAAVCGFRFDPAVLAQVMERPRLAVLRDLGRLQRTRQLVVAEGRGYRFDHHLVQETLYDLVPELLRSEYHAAVGRVLRARLDDGTPASGEREDRAVEACLHLLCGDRGGQALGLLDRARAHLEANNLLGPLADLLGDVLAVPGLVEGRRRAELALARVHALEISGGGEVLGDAIAEARAAAQAAGDVALRVGVLAREAPFLARAARADEAAAVAERARVLSEGAAPSVRADALTASAGVAVAAGDWAAARESFARVLDLAREGGDVRREALTRVGLSQPLSQMGRMAEALEHLRIALDQLEAHGSLREQAGAANNYGNLLRYADRPREAAPMLERALALSRKAGYRGGEANALGNLAALRYARGHLAEVLELLDEAEILARELGQAHLGLEIAEQRGLVLYHLGHLDRARALLEDVRSRWMALGAPGGARVCLFALAEIAAHEGDFDAALAFVDEAAHVERQSGTEDEGFLFPGIRGAILVEAGRREEAIAPLERAVAADPDRELVARATLAALGREDPEAVEAVLRRLGDDLEIYAAMEAWLWLGRATGRAASTRRAHALLQELIAHAPPADRDGLADRLPLYREITAAWREVSGTSPTMGVGPEE